MFTIEKNISIAPREKKREMILQFQKTLRRMEIGDSFLVKKELFAGMSVHYYFRKLKRTNPDLEFTLRTMDKHNFRIWRTS